MFSLPLLHYWVAEQLHSSGVWAVVAGDLSLSTKRLVFLNSTSRIKTYSVWESFVFILNDIVFLNMGLEAPEVVGGLRLEGISLSTTIGYRVLVTAILICAQMISSYVVMIAPPAPKSDIHQFCSHFAYPPGAGTYPTLVHHQRQII